MTFLRSELIISPAQGSTRPPKISPACLLPEQSPHELAMAGLRQGQDGTVAPWHPPKALTGNSDTEVRKLFSAFLPLRPAAAGAL